VNAYIRTFSEIFTFLLDSGQNLVTAVGTTEKFTQKRKQ